MFSPEYCAKLDPSYREALTKLETHLKELKSDQSQKVITDFIGKHMVPPKIWLSVSHRNRYPTYNINNEYNVHFACDSFYYQFDDVHLDIKYYDGDFMYSQCNINDVLVPHKFLDQKMNKFEKKINSFIPREVYQRHEEMKELYLKIKDAEDDVDDWFAVLVKANDLQFVKNNVEYRLGKDLTERKLWKKYINYLKERDLKVLLLTYSKYCRFFTDDIEMKDEYRKAAVKYNAPISVPWKNPYKFEVYDSEFWKKEAKKVDYCPPPEKEPLTIQFDGRNATKPDFPLLSPTIRYILDNASGEVLQKLFMTCKWFRIAQPVNVCYKVNETNKCVARFYTHLHFVDQSIYSTENSFIDKLFISKVFEFFSKDPSALSMLIPKFYRFTAKHVYIRNQQLSMEELQLLIGHGDVTDLNLENIRKSDEIGYNIETLLQFTPKVKYLKMNADCTSETAQKLCEMKFQNKMEQIHFSDLKINTLDPEKFAEFVTKNCSSHAEVKLGFLNGDGKEDYIKNFQTIFDNAMKEKWANKEHPYLFIR